MDRFSYLRDALAIFLVEKDATSVVVTEGGKPVGVIARDTMAEVLGRRIAESTLQPPALRWPSGPAARLRARASRRARVRRLDEAHGAGALAAAGPGDEDATGEVDP